MKKNILYKMDTTLDENNTAQYTLELGPTNISMNSLVGKNVTLEWTQKIYCIDSGIEIKKSYGQGYSYPSFMKLPQCDLCYIKPELCHYDKGTCRGPDWGATHCMVPHIVYLSLTSGPGPKIGITRKKNTPSRWIDQGAVLALPILEVKSRHLAGIIESEIAKEIPDRTQWQKMLKGLSVTPNEHQMLYDFKEQIFRDYAEILDTTLAEEFDKSTSILEIHYPLLKTPEKLKTIDFEKNNKITGTLLGIKGQYLIFEDGVINLRKYQGYEVHFEY